MSTHLQAAELTLHWLDRSRAQRVLWLLEELKLQYKIVTYKRLSDGQAPVSLKAIHPLGKSPVLEIKPTGAPKSYVLAESANIIEYVSEHFGAHLIPAKWKKGQENKLFGESEEWLRLKFYMPYSEGSLMSLAAQAALKDGIKNAPVPFFIKPFTGFISGKIESDFLNHNFDSHLSYLEADMKSSSDSTTSSEGGFICGPSLTPADFMMVFPLDAAQQWKYLTDEKHPLLTDYIRRIQARDAYQKAIQRIISETGSYDAKI